MSDTTLEKLLVQGAELLERYEKSQILLEEQTENYSEKLKIELEYSIKLIKEQIKILDHDESVNDLRKAGLEAEERIEKAEKAFEEKMDESHARFEKLLQSIESQLDTSEIMKAFDLEIDAVVQKAKEEIALSKDEYATTLKELIAKVFQLEKVVLNNNKE